MSKKIIMSNYYNAYYVLHGEWLSVNHTDFQSDDIENNSVIITSKNISAEEKVIKNNLWKNLSLEAQEIINVILNSPKELLESTEQRVTLPKIKKYFSDLWKSSYIAEQTIFEIKQWLKNT